MPVLTTQQRNTLESAVKQARKLAETGARNALHALAIDNPEPFAHMSPEQRTLRNRLRNKARLLGDELPSTGKQETDHLSYELAYENWHKMLFAKFLESNNLLMHTSGVAVTMEECEELAKEEGFVDKWEAAAAYASKMLPAIFRPEDPVMQVNFASNDRIKLEKILDGLDNYIFTADDALGWVYQFWQSEAKEAINKSGDKINGEKLPAVTQLFTEPYMVHFLIDNTIGAWWVSRHPNESPPIKFEYLRLLDDGTPAAGKFEGWPNTAKEITSLDPCMGSGHFVASLFSVFAALRMHEEGLGKGEATEKVIIENLHGLELDARCTQIAAFNLALTAWKFCEHFEELPEMNLACSGIAPKGKKEDWVKLVGKISDPELKARMANGMEVLYDHFQLAPELGSLLDPSSIKADMYTASFKELQPILTRALSNELDKDQTERGVIAAGIAKAGFFLAKKYVLVITNVPYLIKGKQSDVLRSFTEKNYKIGCEELANVFLLKAFKLLDLNGTACVVMPQFWLFQNNAILFREYLLKEKQNNFLARLGAGAFETISGENVKVILAILSNTKIPDDSDHQFSSLDFESQSEINNVAKYIQSGTIIPINQKLQLSNPKKVIQLVENICTENCVDYCFFRGGITTGDAPRFRSKFWEIVDYKFWSIQQTTVDYSTLYSGREHVINWEEGKGNLIKTKGATIAGREVWGKEGISITHTGKIKSTIYTGQLYENITTVAIPKDDENLLAIWCYFSSDKFNDAVREINQKLRVDVRYFENASIDIEYWRKIAKEKFPRGLPKPYSDDATQWIFHGNPVLAKNSLHVSIARLLGYQWPAESDDAMELSDDAKYLIQQVKAFDSLSDEDGILCIPPINGDLAASEKLRTYLQTVYAEDWSNNTISRLLKREAAKESNLEDWLRLSFFEQHNKLFQNRPFIWHIWDGRKDGFAAFVNYHKLDKENLKRLIFTYLGDWIRQCEAKKKSGDSGSEGLLSAALKLKEKLEAILEGESPYDIFVRWKPLEKQPTGWEPDLNDGVRLNIRPFVTADVLRKKPNIKWGVDRGKNPPITDKIKFPKQYFSEIRDNDIHITLEEKRKAREK